jgi:hypothetical protein
MLYNGAYGSELHPGRRRLGQTGKSRGHESRLVRSQGRRGESGHEIQARESLDCESRDEQSRASKTRAWESRAWEGDSWESCFSKSCFSKSRFSKSGGNESCPCESCSGESRRQDAGPASREILRRWPDGCHHWADG